MLRYGRDVIGIALISHVCGLLSPSLLVWSPCGLEAGLDLGAGPRTEAGSLGRASSRCFCPFDAYTQADTAQNAASVNHKSMQAFFNQLGVWTALAAFYLSCSSTTNVGQFSSNRGVYTTDVGWRCRISNSLDRMLSSSMMHRFCMLRSQDGDLGLGEHGGLRIIDR